MRRVSTKNVDQTISPGQARAGRALLEMTQAQLAKAAGLGLSTIVDFEKNRRDVSVEAISAVKSALECAGIQFIAENGGGPGVRLRKRQVGTKGAAPATHGLKARKPHLISPAK